jgi:hypothetical protein
MRQLSARKSEQGGGVAQLRVYATSLIYRATIRAMELLKSNAQIIPEGMVFEVCSGLLIPKTGPRLLISMLSSHRDDFL